MRPGQKNRGRGGRNMMGGGHPQNRQGGGRPPHRIQNFDSSGPSVKIRGNAYQVFERYIAMAREAASAGDRVAAENLYQHAEHYYRIMQANGGHQDQMAQRPMTPADNDMGGGDDVDGHGSQPNPQGQPHQPQPSQMQPPPHQPQPQAQPQAQPQPQPQPQLQPPHQQAAPDPVQSGPQPPIPPVDPDYSA
ncbi:MAG: DUF4167 domain-containing protein [Alphaproteobacteria bacterium]|nr:DUF4167 domain-containing protein [Alphaproteobacteria bacterium]